MHTWSLGCLLKAGGRGYVEYVWGALLLNQGLHHEQLY